MTDLQAIADPRARTPEYTVVRMVNQSPEPFTGKYTGQEFHAGPGEQIFVPFHAMCLWAGHPDAIDIDRQRRYRTDEWNRLRVKYGVHSFGGCWTTEICPGNPGPDGKPKHPPRRHLPNIHFYDVATNSEYQTVLIDPEGKGVAKDHLHDNTQGDLQSRAMRDLQAQVESLQRDLARMQSQSGVPTPPPAPEPRIPPTPGSSTPPGLPDENQNDVDDDEPSVSWDSVDGDHAPPRDPTWPETGPLERPMPVDEDAIEQARAKAGKSAPTKPRIPPSPGPLPE